MYVLHVRYIIFLKFYICEQKLVFITCLIKAHNELCKRKSIGQRVYVTHSELCIKTWSQIYTQTCKLFSHRVSQSSCSRISLDHCFKIYVCGSLCSLKETVRYWFQKHCFGTSVKLIEMMDFSNIFEKLGHKAVELRHSFLLEF